MAKLAVNKAMKLVKYLLAPWTAALVYVVSLILWGPMGFSAYDQLKMEEARLRENMTALEQINTELENTRKALFHDRDTIILRARELGYAPEGEKFVRIVGLPVSRQAQPSPGQVVNAGRPAFIPDEVLRIISVCIGAGIFMALALVDFVSYSRRRAEKLYYSIPDEQDE
ncbi:hypothetical protein AGMMS49928_01600 [Spirochaetia bacterium]|nr:hypothetical protein AGMMS49928_01600 [Spirochaetia bacterium]